MIFFFQNFFHCNLRCSELVYRRNYFNLAKIFVLKLFKLAEKHSAPG